MEINGRLLNFKHSINCGVFSLTCKAISQFVVNIYYDRLKKISFTIAAAAELLNGPQKKKKTEKKRNLLSLNKCQM